MFHRPARTVVSVLGIAVGVLLIVFTVGLSEGSLGERGKREANVGAEIYFGSRGSLSLSGSDALGVPASMRADLQKVDGVETVVQVAQNSVSASDTNTGSRLIDGVEFDEYARVAGLTVKAGRKLGATADDEAMVDTGFQNQKKIKIGDKLKMWDREFTVVGAYEPAAGARVKIPLAAMQKQLGGEGFVSAFLVKLKPGVVPDQVAEALQNKYPENRVLLTSAIPELYMQGIPALNVFLNVVIGVAAVISALVILLTMYTTVTERTRQIGIMKSLGMSNPRIAWTITQEAMLLSFLGIVTGVVLTVLLKFVLTRVTTLEISISPTLVAFTTITGLLGGVLGALYPALKAAGLDAVEALSYE